MKKITILSVLGAAAMFTGCTKIMQLANINADIPYNYEVSVPIVQGDTAGITLPAGISLSFPSIAFATNSAQYLSQYGSAAKMVTSVSLKSLAIQILNPTSRQNFDFLDNIDVYMYGKGLPEKLVASQSSIAKGAATLDLNTNNDVDLKEYFVQDTIYFRLNAHINAIPPTGEQLNIASVFHMLANPLN